MSDRPYDVLHDALSEEVPPVPGPSGPVRAGDSDDRPAPWESSLQATCDSLALRGALDTLERRQAEDRLGETVYRQFPSRPRPAIVTAHLLMDKGVVTPEELEAKMAEVRARFERTE